MALLRQKTTRSEPLKPNSITALPLDTPHSPIPSKRTLRNNQHRRRNRPMNEITIRSSQSGGESEALLPWATLWCEDIRMLMCLRYVEYLNVSINNTLPKHVVVNTNVPAIRTSHRVIRQIYRPLVFHVPCGTPNVAVRQKTTPDISRENCLAETRGCRYVPLPRGRMRHASLLPRIERYTDISLHHNSTRDRPAAIGVVRTICIHV